MIKFNILDIFMINLLILLFIFDFVVLGGIILGAYLITKIEEILIDKARAKNNGNIRRNNIKSK